MKLSEQLQAFNDELAEGHGITYSSGDFNDMANDARALEERIASFGELTEEVLQLFCLTVEYAKHLRKMGCDDATLERLQSQAWKRAAQRPGREGDVVRKRIEENERLRQAFDESAETAGDMAPSAIAIYMRVLRETMEEK